MYFLSFLLFFGVLTWARVGYFSLWLEVFEVSGVFLFLKFFFFKMRLPPPIKTIPHGTLPSRT